MANIKVNVVAVVGAALGVISSLMPWLYMSMGPDKDPWSFIAGNPYMSSVNLYFASLMFLLGVFVSFATNLGWVLEVIGLLAFYLGVPYEWGGLCGPNGMCLWVVVHSEVGVGPLVGSVSAVMILASILIPVSLDPSYEVRMSKDRFLTFSPSRRTVVRR